MFLQFIGYLSAGVLIIGLIFKILKYALLPEHLRWELYPVAHETKEKLDYGGSYFEEVDWWEKKIKKSLFNEIKEMLEEILLLKGVYKNNKQLWNASFPFHIGLYSLVAHLGFLFIGALLQVFGIPIVTTNLVGKIIHYLTIGTGVLGFTIASIGAIGLIIKRATNENLKKYSSIVDFFNLSFLLSIFVFGFLSWIIADPYFAMIREFIYGLITFKFVIVQNIFTVITIILTSAFFIYYPFTHMTHPIAKYFTYHSIRWGDKENTKGSKLESKVLKNLQRQVSWEAPHIKSGGTWVDAATSD